MYSTRNGEMSVLILILKREAALEEILLGRVVKTEYGYEIYRVLNQCKQCMSGNVFNMKENIFDYYI